MGDGVVVSVATRREGSNSHSWRASLADFHSVQKVVLRSSCDEVEVNMGKEVSSSRVDANPFPSKLCA